MKNEDLEFLIPDVRKMPCKNCKHKCFGVMDLFCEVYRKKPHDVYYMNKSCPKFEKEDDSSILTK